MVPIEISTIISAVIGAIVGGFAVYHITKKQWSKEMSLRIAHEIYSPILKEMYHINKHTKNLSIINYLLYEEIKKLTWEIIEILSREATKLIK